MTRQTKPVPPDTRRVVEGFRDTGYTFNSAVADIVDNSITANASVVSVMVDLDPYGDPHVWVGDDGDGMTLEGLEDAMRYGSRRRTERHSLSRFGLGLKTASTSFCRRLTVVSRTLSSGTHSATWDIDLITQVTTLVLQAVVTGQLMKRLGVAVALALLPIVVSLGFIGLAMAGSFAMLILFDASFRAIQRAITRPARETLFTVVTREEKYKSKAFTDTFVYRGGDVIGAWTEGGLGALGMGLVGLASVAVPMAVAWGGLGMWLGRRQQQVAAVQASAQPPISQMRT